MVPKRAVIKDFLKIPKNAVFLKYIFKDFFGGPREVQKRGFFKVFLELTKRFQSEFFKDFLEVPKRFNNLNFLKICGGPKEVSKCVFFKDFFRI